MKKSYYFTVIILVLFIVLFISESRAQNFNKIDAAPHDISYYRETRVTPPLAKVLYGRPIKNGEKIFGSAIPYGKIWRTGADEATEIKFYKDVQFGNTIVSAGTYVLLSIPGEKEWEIILNSKLDVLGAFQYNPMYDIARIKVPVSNAENLDYFSIAFKNENDIIEMVMGWDTTRVKIPLIFDRDPVLVNN
jgi:hypothetical protein